MELNWFGLQEVEMLYDVWLNEVHLGRIWQGHGERAVADEAQMLLITVEIVGTQRSKVVTL